MYKCMYIISSYIRINNKTKQTQTRLINYKINNIVPIETGFGIWYQGKIFLKTILLDFEKYLLVVQIHRGCVLNKKQTEN